MASGYNAVVLMTSPQYAPGEAGHNKHGGGQMRKGVEGSGNIRQMLPDVIEEMSMLGTLN